MSVHPEPDHQLLVTGASGFTGKNLVPLARSRGFDVVCLTSDVRDVQALRAEICATNPTFVVHLAGVSNTQCRDVDLLHDVNVRGTRNLLQALVDTGKSPRRVLLASSVLVYGTTPASPVTEDHALVPFNAYTASKIDMEAAASEFASRLPICIVRPFNYTGVGQPATFLIPKLVDHFATKQHTVQLGNVNVQREFNDVRYVCDVYMRLLLADTCLPVYNVCSGHAHAIEDVLRALTDITGHRVAVKVNPAFVRDTDILRLCGSTQRLQSTLGKEFQALLASKNALHDLLTWMVDHTRE